MKDKIINLAMNWLPQLPAGACLKVEIANNENAGVFLVLTFNFPDRKLDKQIVFFIKDDKDTIMQKAIEVNNLIAKHKVLRELK